MDDLQTQINRIEQFLAWQATQQHAAMQQQQQAALQQAVLQHYFAAAGRHMQDPGFVRQYQTLVNQRISEYEAVGYSPSEAAQLANNDEFALAARAIQQGRDPIDHITGLAEARGITREEPSPADDRNSDYSLDLEALAALPDAEFSKALKAYENQERYTRNEARLRPSDDPDIAEYERIHPSRGMSPERLAAEEASNADIAALVDELWPSDAGGMASDADDIIGDFVDSQVGTSGDD
jgi:hypothetical protein